MMLSHSDVLVLVHLVWSTLHRARLLRPADDWWFETQLREAAGRCGARVIAVGIAWDHIHCIAVVPADVAVAEVAQRLKGSTSHAWNERAGKWCNLRWQRGYWARSIDQKQLPDFIGYLARQRDRHARKEIDAALEQTANTLANRHPDSR